MNAETHNSFTTNNSFTTSNSFNTNSSSNSSDAFNASNTRSKLPLYFLFLTFVLPVAAAALLLKTGWYDTMGTNNQGTLINPPVALHDVISRQHPLPENALSPTWKLLFVMPSECGSACENNLYLMSQIKQALGPDKFRVEPLVIKPQQRMEMDQALRNVFPAEPSPTETSHLYLVDPQGMIFMHYPAIADRHEAILKGRDVIKDLKHALKLSKIG